MSQNAIKSVDGGANRTRTSKPRKPSTLDKVFDMIPKKHREIDSDNQRFKDSKLEKLLDRTAIFSLPNGLARSISYMLTVIAVIAFLILAILIVVAINFSDWQPYLNELLS